MDRKRGEMTPGETIYILQEYEGNEGKGKIFMDVNKKSIIINTKINLGFSFPSKPRTSGKMRLNDIRNSGKFKPRIMTPVLIRKQMAK